MGKLTWYGVRCIFKWRNHPSYEERITVWRAESFEAAVELAEAEAKAYADAVGFEYLRLAQAFDTRAVRISHGSEMFSLIRTSSLEPSEYLNRFFDSGSEHQKVSLS